MNNRMKSAIERVSLLSSLNNDRDASDHDVLLAKEYLRRIAVMAKTFPDWNLGPFFDTKMVTNIELETPVRSEIERLLSSKAQPNAYVRKLCADYIKWNAYADIGNSVASSNLDIYEPLLRLFERGQEIGLHHGELMIGSFAIPLNRWLEFAELTPLNLE
jgi:hypothetical protein